MDEELIERARTIDLLALAGRFTRLKRVASTGGGEYAGPCPICNAGRDRFRVQPHRAGGARWFCRKCTNTRWQDVIAFQMRLTGQDFPEAVRALAGERSALAPPPRPLEPCENERPAALPSEGWQDRARSLIVEAQRALWAPEGARARAWLAARGLMDDTLRHWQIGYLSGDRRESAKVWYLTGRPVYLPRGILIPCQVHSAIWYLKIRRPAGKPKYQLVRGSRPALYMADTLAEAREAAFVTEGELDALLLWQSLQQAPDPRTRAYGIVTAGGISGRIDLRHWARDLYRVRRLFVAPDQDGKSQPMIDYWTGYPYFAQILAWRNLREDDKDLTDYHLSGGSLHALATSTVYFSQLRDEIGTRADGGAESFASYDHLRLEAPLQQLGLFGRRKEPGLPIAQGPVEVEEAWWDRVFAERSMADPAAPPAENEDRREP